MPIRIFNNTASVNAQRLLGVNNDRLALSVERISSGLRINRGADDAAGLAISEGLRSDTRTLKVTIENLRAADLTICETDIAKEIATLTRRYIIGAAPTAREE